MKKKNLIALFVWLFLIQFGGEYLSAQQPRKLAFFVGVSKYKKDGLDDLKYAHKDATDLSELLGDKSNGFEVTLITAEDATLANVVKKLGTFFEKTRDLGKDDIVMVCFSGHGVQMLVPDGNRKVETPFFCVFDSNASDPQTMISLNWVLEELKKSGSSSNLLIVDACRNNPSKGARTLDGSTVRELPTKISILFSSSPGRQSFESDKVKQGIFTHVLLEGLKGAAKNSRDEVDWLRLAAHTVSEVPRVAGSLSEDPTLQQRPNLVGNVLNSPVLIRKVARVRPLKLRFPFSEREATDAQSLWAKYLERESSERVKNGHEMVLIPPGEFMMGNEESVDDIMKAYSFLKNLKREWFEDVPQHRVELTEPFLISSTEVTVGQFRAFVEATGYQTDAEKGKGGWGYDSKEKKLKGPDPKFSWRTTGWEQTDRHPVVNVSWNDAVAYCEWLSEKTGSQYTLPTEAQWEYCCRSGSEGRYYFGNQPQDLVRFSNTWDASTKEHFPDLINQLNDSDRMPFSSPVGRYRSNAFGLYDMHGNALEWCLDRYEKDYYDQSPVRDPKGPQDPASGSFRVLRGGSWSFLATDCRSATRSCSDPSNSRFSTGFRVVLLVR